MKSFLTFKNVQNSLCILDSTIYWAIIKPVKTFNGTAVLKIIARSQTPILPSLFPWSYQRILHVSYTYNVHHKAINICTFKGKKFCNINIKDYLYFFDYTVLSLQQKFIMNMKTDDVDVPGLNNTPWMAANIYFSLLAQ